MYNSKIPALQPWFRKNDALARWLIGIFSLVVFLVVVALGKIKLEADFGFSIHLFALINAVVNSLIALLLVAGLVLVKQKQWVAHRNVMISALVLSVVFLLSYIMHKLFAGEAIYGDADHNGLLDPAEQAAAGTTRFWYLLLLATHIILAAGILPFILFAAYRALTAEYGLHKKLTRWVWPLWMYVAVTGPVVYWLIKPYYT